ncbi:DUF4368 domain-containing protein [Lachnospiraceae bacterium MD335]|nr:DUF4368 domain-containing protein [Lachnospiraceae bacterium MD335]
MDMIGDEKTALFVIISDTDDTFNFIVSIMYTQLFNLLCDRADDVYHGRLPVHVRCLLDEFANIGQIPKFEKLIATIRSREILASIILQSKSQLKAIYKDNADTIEGNCDTTLFLGGKEKTTLKEMAEILGKETIDLYNTSDTRGTSQSYGLNYQRFLKLTDAMEKEQESNQNRMQEIAALISEEEHSEGDVQMFMGEIRRYAAITELDETVLNRLINRILIGEPKKVDGVKTQEVRIVYNFVGEL